jgi:hypothetical protein
MLKYIGSVYPLDGAPGESWVHNPNREVRPKPAPGDPCPFEVRIQTGNYERVEMIAGFQRFAGYCRFENAFPIVGGQDIWVPLEYRTEPLPEDVALMVAVAESGRAAYVNSSGAGQSIARLHVNSVPEAGVVLLSAAACPWSVCGGAASGASVRRAEGVPFYALTVCGSSAEDRAASVAALAGYLLRTGTPYNLLAWRSLTAVSVAVVPRSVEMSDTALQRVAGLELLTRVLLPGSSSPDKDLQATVRESFDVRARDRALREETLNPVAVAALEGRLRAEFGPPAAGLAVYAAD